MSPINMQKLESGIRLAAELIEKINAHKLDDVMKLFGDDCVMEPIFTGHAGTLITGKGNIRKYFELLLMERGNLHYATEEFLGFGHRCIIRWMCTWKDTKGVERSLRGVDIIREKNDRISEILSYCRSEF